MMHTAGLIAWKFLPVTVTDPPEAAGSTDGITLKMVAAVSYRYSVCDREKSIPFLDTSTDTIPSSCVGSIHNASEAVMTLAVAIKGCKDITRQLIGSAKFSPCNVTRI